MLMCHPRVDCLPLLKQSRGHMIGLDEEDCDYLFGSAIRSLEFHRWGLTCKKPDWRLLLGFRVIKNSRYPWQCPRPVLTRPRQMVRSMWRHHSNLFILYSSVIWGRGASNGCFPTHRWWRRIQFKPANERLKLSSISFCVIRGSPLISHFLLAALCSAATVTCWSLRSLSSNIVLPNWNSFTTCELYIKIAIMVPSLLAD